MQNALSETQKQAQMSLESRKFRRKWERPAYRTPRSPMYSKDVDGEIARS
jgi:hypothetical protein